MTEGRMYVVQEGDCMSSIAEGTGFFWKTLWDDPANQELKERRGDPNVLLPGDRVWIPGLRPKTVQCATGRRHVFRRKGVPVKLRLVIRDASQTPCPGKKYVLKVGPRTYEGVTTAEGLVEEYVMPSVNTGELTVWLSDQDPAGYIWPLELGFLDPVSTVRGAKARLSNLGFDCGPVDGEIDDRTREALSAFQEKNGLTQTGELDEETRSLLAKMHDRLSG